MEFFVVSCLILLSIQTTPTYSLPKPINNILREKIENIRQQMPCGINGGPGLVPFRQKFVDVSYDNSSTIGIAGFLQDIQVDNLNKFVVDKIDFSLLRLKLDFSFTLPSVSVSGIYNITGQYLNRIKLWGNGPFSVELNDLQLSGSFRLRIVNGYLDMTELQIILLLNSLNSNICGILGSEEISLIFNAMIVNSIPELLSTYSTDIGQFIGKYVTSLANEYLHELTLSDIIGGGNGNEQPCVI